MLKKRMTKMVIICINNVKSKFLLKIVFMLPGKTEEGPSVDLLGASPKANPG